MKLAFFKMVNSLFFGSNSKRVGVPLEKRIARAARRGEDRYN